MKDRHGRIYTVTLSPDVVLESLRVHYESTDGRPFPDWEKDHYSVPGDLPLPLPAVPC